MTKNKEQLAPQIRFKGFTDAWVQRKLGETNSHYTDGNYGESYPSENELTSSDNGVPFLRGSNLKSGMLSKDGANYITKEKHAELTSGHIEEDDIILAVRGSLGSLGYATKENVGWNINSQLAIIRTDKNELQGNYLVQFLLSEAGQKELLSRNTGTALKQLPIKQLKDVPIPITSIIEQTAIGNFFHTLDTTITLHKRKLDGLKELKKGYLQQMFPQNGENVPRLRFGGFTGAWQEVKLGDIAEFNPPSTLPSSFEYVDLESVVGTSLISYRTENKETAPSRAQRLAKQGDVFFQTVRPYQMNNFLFELPYDNYVFSTGYAQLRPQIDSYFLLCKLQEKNFVNKVLDRCTGTSYPAVNSTDLTEIEVCIASDKAEQIAIGILFRNLDRQITTQAHKVEQLKKVKSAYLQKMFL